MMRSAPSLRGAKRRSNPSFRICWAMDCFASLAMTAGYVFAFSRHDLSEFYRSFRPLSKARAQGKPGARRTRGLACHVHKESAHTSIQVRRRHPGLPCAMVLRLIRARPGETLLLCHHHPRSAFASHGLTTSIGAAGPHDFAVRLCAQRQSHTRRPPHLHPRSGRCATPLLSGEMGYC